MNTTALKFIDRLRALAISQSDYIGLSAAYEHGQRGDIDMGFSQLRALSVAHGVDLAPLHTHGLLKVAVERIVSELEAQS